MAHDEREGIVVFGSDVIDLSDIDLAALSELPSAPLRAAIARVHEELSGDGDQSAVYARFRSSLRAMHRENRSSEVSDEADESTGTLR